MKTFVIHTLTLASVVVLVFLSASSNEETVKLPSSSYDTGIQDEPYRPPVPKNLFHLTSNSSFVVVGKVVKTDLVRKRLSKEEMDNLDDLGKVLGGRLSTIQVETALCSKQDFVIGGTVSSSPNQILIFKKRDSNKYFKEWYNDGEKYLLFLSGIPEQEILTKQYELDNKQIYYEAFEGERLKLTDETPALLLQLEAFCGAAHGSDPHEKIARLTNLMAITSDVEVKRSAQEAINFIKEKMPK